MTSVSPRIIVLREGRAGDDRQLINLAEALGQPYEVVPFHCHIGRVLLDRTMDMVGIEGPPAGRTNWGPPWPDLVLASGGRAVSAAIRLRRISGGRTKTVFVGRPWARLDHFDLVVTTPQYRLPEAVNVIQNLLPLNYIPETRLGKAQAAIAPRLAHLPSPRLSVLLGGDSGSYRFDAETAADLGQKVNAQARAKGGSVLVTSSPRTPAAAMDALLNQLDVPGEVYWWRPNDSANPLVGYLATADELIVTGESASMLAEAFRSGKPVQIAALPRRRRTRFLARSLSGHFAKISRLTAPIRRWLTYNGLWVPPRDLERLHRALEQYTSVVDSTTQARRLDADDDLRRTVAAIGNLLAVQGATAYKAVAQRAPEGTTRPAENKQGG